MRMWKVDPTKMCRKHLLGEHVEMHMFVGSINKGISMEGYMSNGLVDVCLIEERHEELVAEMDRRGYKHKSDLPKFNWFAARRGSVDIEGNKKELARRCKECKFV